MPLERRGEHWFKIQLKVWLSARAEGIESSVGSLDIAVGCVLVQSFINAREADHLQKTATQRAGLVTTVGVDGSVVCLAWTKQVVIQA